MKDHNKEIRSLTEAANNLYEQMSSEPTPDQSAPQDSKKPDPGPVTPSPMPEGPAPKPNPNWFIPSEDDNWEEIPTDAHPWLDYWWGPPPPTGSPFGPGGIWHHHWNNSNQQNNRGGWLYI